MQAAEPIELIYVFEDFLFELSGLGAGQQHDLAYGQFIQFGITGFTSLSSFLVLNPEASYEETF